MNITPSAPNARTSGWGNTRFGQPRVGMVAESTGQISMADVELFAAITCDRDPLCYDKEAAAGVRFGRLFVQGGITSGLLNAVVAEALPGPGSIFLGVEWQLEQAIRIGETITARVEVTSVRDDKPICALHTTVRDARGDICLFGTVVTYTMPLL